LKGEGRGTGGVGVYICTGRTFLQSFKTLTRFTKVEIALKFINPYI